MFPFVYSIPLYTGRFLFLINSLLGSLSYKKWDPLDESRFHFHLSCNAE